MQREISKLQKLFGKFGMTTTDISRSTLEMTTEIIALQGHPPVTKLQRDRYNNKHNNIPHYEKTVFFDGVRRHIRNKLPRRRYL